jgi:imidazolonepropionase
MVENLLLCMSLGMTQMGMTGAEVWRGVTQHAASAVNRHDRGMIQPGYIADLVLYNCTSVLEVPYRMGSMKAHQVYKDGECVYTNDARINSAIHAK